MRTFLRQVEEELEEEEERIHTSDVEVGSKTDSNLLSPVQGPRLRSDSSLTEGIYTYSITYTSTFLIMI